MSNILKMVFVGALAFGAISCVPLKQYQELSDKNKELRSEKSTLAKDNDQLEVQSHELQAKIIRLNKKVGGLQADNERLDLAHQKLQYKLDDLNKSYQNALAQLNSTSHDGDTSDLLAYLQKLQEDIQKREDDLIKAERELLEQQRILSASQNDLENAKLKLGEQGDRLVQLEEALRQKEEAMLALRQSVSDALTGFSSDELNVHMKNGKVYVSMEEKLLFQSGKYNVNAQGVDALTKMASVLAQHKDIDIVVEGHTDEVPFSGSVIQDNWDLSVKRATSVVRILLSSDDIEATRISATGRAEFLPLVEEKSQEAYRKNRRTEIILTPKLDKLLDILGE